MYRKIPMPREKDISSADREHFWLAMGLAAFGGSNDVAPDTSKSQPQAKRNLREDKKKQISCR